MVAPEKLHFITSSGIKNIVGKDLITDRFVAIFELVKNSYDAKAGRVIVSFDEASNGAQSITIHDNGIGMGKVDLEKKWLHLAYSEKKEGHKNEGRAFVGSKGIGRFSCDSLGSKLKIVTKKKGTVLESVLVIDWSDFEKSLEDRFEDVSVEYTTNVVSQEKYSESYTTLYITDLHHLWDSDAIKRVSDSLQRLKNPFNDSDGFELFCGPDISQLLDNPKEIPQKFLVKNGIAAVLKGKSITIEVKLDTNISVCLFDRGQHIFTLEKANDSILRNVGVFISINYLTTSAKATFTRRMGIEAVNYGNVFIYRNGFRVSPYGDRDFDLFGLNLRKTQGYNRYLGTREIIGYIDISDHLGIFKETSSRNNGFIENIHLDALKDVYMDFAHKPLEKYVTLVKWGEDSDTLVEVGFDSIGLSEAEKFKRSITSKVNGGFNLKYFSDDVSFEDNNPQKKLEKIASSLNEGQKEEVGAVIQAVSTLLKENKEQSQSLLNQSQTIKALKLQAENISKRRSESEFGEQLSHHFPSMADRLSGVVDELNPLQSKLSLDDTKVFLSALRKIKKTEFELRSFKNLLLNTSIDLRSPQTLSWYDLANRFIKDKSPLPSSRNFLKLNCSSIDTDVQKDWFIRSNAIEVMMMFENFYRNAIDHGATFLEIYFDHDKILISSDSTPISAENLEKIFELGFSTKGNGTGIGLDQVRTFLKRCKLRIQAGNFNHNVVFTITK